MQKQGFVAFSLVFALLMALVCGAAVAQQPTTDLWKLVPPNSLVVAALDMRPENASMQVIANAQDLQTKEMVAKQSAAMRKAIEDFATLFGVSLDFAKDIDPWKDRQCAFVLLPGEKNSKQPVILIASKDAASASAALQKLLEPWGRIGQLTPEPDNDFPITAFRVKDRNVEVFASAYGPVVAIAINKDALKQALRGGGFPAGSTGDKALSALSGSVFYAYADAALLGVFDVKPEAVPVGGVGIGASAIDTGLRLQVLGYPTENGLAMLQQMLAGQQTGSLLANAAVPSGSLATTSLPNLAGPVAMAGGMGLAKAPIFGAALAASNLKMSASITAVFPRLAWVVSGMAESAESAAQKRGEIEASLRKAKITVEPESGTASRIKLSDSFTAYISQHDKYVLVADDPRSLIAAAEVIDGTRPGIAQSKTYQETMAGLGNSNLLTLYANLAPIQGLGFLAEGLGIDQVTSIHNGLAKSLENVQSLGIGAGFDGQVASATIFLRAKPGLAPTIGPVVAATAVGAAVLYPMFYNARESARVSVCMSNMKQIAIGAKMYADDHDGKLPSRANWRAELEEYTRKPIDDLLKCPSGGSMIAFNKNLAGLNIDKIGDPAQKVLFFEASPDLANAAGSRADAMLPHDGEGYFAFADGHVEKLCEAPEQSQWVPTVAKKPVTKAPAKKAPVRKHRH